MTPEEILKTRIGIFCLRQLLPIARKDLEQDEIRLKAEAALLQESLLLLSTIDVV